MRTLANCCARVRDGAFDEDAAHSLIEEIAVVFSFVKVHETEVEHGAVELSQ